MNIKQTIIDEMDSVSVINKIKYNKSFFKLYKKIGDFALRCLKAVIKPDDSLILFVCYGGRKYDDSPRCIYESMIEDCRFDGYKFVWAFIKPEKHKLKGRGEKIKIDTWSFFVTALKARVWVSNSNVSRGLSFKGKHTFDFNTWHGSAIKRLGMDMAIQSFANVSEKKSASEKKTSPYDVFCAQSPFDVEVLSRAFQIPEGAFKIIGLPRNDELVSRNREEIIIALKHKLGIPYDKKVILYAPTFREYERDKSDNCVLAPPMNIEKWKNELGGRFILLFRAHYEVIKYMDVGKDSFVKDVSNYPNLNELLLITDICVSDYSSVFFDFSILGRPMLCWAYDFEEYCKKRGLYFDIRHTLHCEDLQTETDLIKRIINLNEEERKHIAVAFREKYVTEYGSATKKALDVIADNLVFLPSLQ